jgi:hypothetical protein
VLRFGEVRGLQMAYDWIALLPVDRGGNRRASGERHADMAMLGTPVCVIEG